MGDFKSREITTVLPPQAIDVRTLPGSVTDAMATVARADERLVQVATSMRASARWKRVRLGVATAFLMGGLVVTPVAWKVASWAMQRYYYVPLSTWLTERGMAFGGYSGATFAIVMVVLFFLWLQKGKEWNTDVFMIMASSALFLAFAGFIMGSGVGWLLGAFLPWLVALIAVVGAVIVAVGIPWPLAAPDLEHQKSVARDTRSPFLRKLKEAIAELNITAAALRHLQAQTRAGHNVPRLGMIESVVTEARITIDRELGFVAEALEWGVLGSYFVTGEDLEHVTELEKTVRNLQELHLDDSARARAAIEVGKLAGLTS